MRSVHPDSWQGLRLENRTPMLDERREWDERGRLTPREVDFAVFLRTTAVVGVVVTMKSDVADGASEATHSGP